MFCIAPATEQGKQSSVCFPVSVGRLKQKGVRLATKSSGRRQQLQLCRQRVPCSRCADRESRVADSSTCRRNCQRQLHWLPVRQRVQFTVASAWFASRCPGRRLSTWPTTGVSCPTALGALCAQLTFPLACCRQHSAVMCRQNSCSRRTSPVQLSPSPAA